MKIRKKQMCIRDRFASVITEVGCRMNEAMNRERDKTAKKVILEAKQYILDHYQDPELSVDVMCRQLHMLSLIHI